MHICSILTMKYIKKSTTSDFVMIYFDAPIFMGPHSSLTKPDPPKCRVFSNLVLRLRFCVFDGENKVWTTPEMFFEALAGVKKTA